MSQRGAPNVKTCGSCKHFKGVQETEIDEESTEVTLSIVTCDAFPEGIPDAIYEGEELHRTPVDGDNGVVYDAMPKKDAAGVEE